MPKQNQVTIYITPAVRRKAATVARLYSVKRWGGKVNLSATIEAAFDAAIAAKQAAPRGEEQKA